MADSAPQSMARTIGIISKPFSLRLAQALGLTTTLLLTGQSLAASTTSLPLLQHSALLDLPQSWDSFRTSASYSGIIGRPAVGLSVAVAGVWTWCASREPSSRTPAFWLFATAAGAAGVKAVWDVALKGTAEWRISRALGLKDEGQGQGDEKSTREVLEEWRIMNFGTVGLGLLSAGFAVWGIVSEDVSIFELFQQP